MKKYRIMVDTRGYYYPQSRSRWSPFWHPLSDDGCKELRFLSFEYAEDCIIKDYERSKQVKAPRLTFYADVEPEN